MNRTLQRGFGRPQSLAPANGPVSQPLQPWTTGPVPFPQVFFRRCACPFFKSINTAIPDGIDPAKIARLQM